MWAAFRILRLFNKDLSRIALSLEDIASLYRLDLASRGIVPTDISIQDQVEVSYGYTEDRNV